MSILLLQILPFVGYVIGVFTWALPLRSVSKLILLQGGKALKVSTYSHFGKTRTFTVPLEHASFMQTRISSGTNLSFKIKKHMGYFLMDKNAGRFHERELFDYVVGLHRRL